MWKRMQLFRKHHHLSLAKHNFKESKIDRASAECFIRNKPKKEKKTVLKIVSLEHEALKWQSWGAKAYKRLKFFCGGAFIGRHVFAQRCNFRQMIEKDFHSYQIVMWLRTRSRWENYISCTSSPPGSGEHRWWEGDLECPAAPATWLQITDGWGWNVRGSKWGSWREDREMYRRAAEMINLHF